MSESTDNIEIAAREAHARKCRSYNICEPDRIARYWESCDQEMYRRRARDAALPEPPK